MQINTVEKLKSDYKPEIWTALHLDQWRILVDLLARLLLLLVLEQIGHHGAIIWQVQAQVYRDGLAPTVMLELVCHIHTRCAHLGIQYPNQHQDAQQFSILHYWRGVFPQFSGFRGAMGEH